VAVGSVVAYRVGWRQFFKEAAYHNRTSRDSIHLRIPGFLDRWSFDSTPPWFEALEVVSAVASVVTYQVFWCLVAARKPEPPEP
jgi:hypothetical protein